ncbi:MAG: hypothetical protein LBR87_02530 [Synergistaceae bacterium]|jgi:hypothetical protein|nr:hypothetical protein [Synergistaceae bacterium]
MSPEKIKELAELVIERISEKRIGFLWRGSPLRFERAERFAWVHYCIHGSHSVPREKVYHLGGVRDPLSEGGTLDMLVVLDGNAGLMLEVACGVTVSPASMLIEGALRASVPVLYDVSILNKWAAAADSAARDASRRIMETLSSRGAEFIGEAGCGACGIETAAVTKDDSPVTLSGGGWLSWTEISPVVSGRSAVRLAFDTRLTPEASDRLARLNIRVEEVVC